VSECLFQDTKQDGTFTTFDPPGSILTIANGINPAGTITGVYFDPSLGSRGFVRARNGVFTTFAGPPGSFINPIVINPQGTVTGTYDDASSQHGFLWTP
jgi:hypothetical protein